MPLSVKQVEAAKPIWDKAKQKWRENRLSDGEQLYLIAQNAKDMAYAVLLRRGRKEADHRAFSGDDPCRIHHLEENR